MIDSLLHLMGKRYLSMHMSVWMVICFKSYLPIINEKRKVDRKLSFLKKSFKNVLQSLFVHGILFLVAKTATQTANKLLKKTSKKLLTKRDTICYFIEVASGRNDNKLLFEN
ncbi:hypothetical protein ABE28_020950 [Peribacillus muralis]|uniref:Uncharacterized protein n=1 Tax=Peribacillus muralis TaxID=264697 RepID=A0A1B3XUE2_9BACI|nr:hypothetical protein ABE28_020950 [Peribacillus muralis]